MRKLTLSVLFGLLAATTCLAQGPPKALLLPLVRVMDAWMDIEILTRLIPLTLTDAQLQALAAVYQQFPHPPPDLAKATEAAGKVEAFRLKLLAGGEMKPADMEGMGKMLQDVFKEFGDNGMGDGKPTDGLSVEEKLVWAVLTPDQQGKLMSSGGMMGGGPAGDVASRALSLLKRLRGMEDADWVKARDRLVELLAAQSGAEGTPARANAKQMFLDFLNRVRGMTEADFAAKQKELGAEAATLIPQGANLSAVMLEFDPTPIHMMLAMTLLNNRAPALLQELQTARAKPAGGGQ